MNDNALLITTTAAVLSPAPSRVIGDLPRATPAPGGNVNAFASSVSRETIAAQPATSTTNKVMRSQSPPTLPKTTTEQSTTSSLSTTPNPVFDGTDPAVMERVVESINSFLQSSKRSLEFSVDQTTGRPIIKVWDAEHEELIRQIPPEETLRLVEHFLDGNGIQTTGLTDKA